VGAGGGAVAARFFGDAAGAVARAAATEGAAEGVPTLLLVRTSGGFFIKGPGGLPRKKGFAVTRAVESKMLPPRVRADCLETPGMAAAGGGGGEGCVCVARS
jgi:hypothetical protein